MPINVTKEPLSAIKVRQAAALSINQDEIPANVLPATGRWRKPS